MSRFEACINTRARALVSQTQGATAASGVLSTKGLAPKAVLFKPLQREVSDNEIAYSTVTVSMDRHNKVVMITLAGPPDSSELTVESVARAGDQFWFLRLTRELDDAMLHLRFNEPELGTILFKSTGNMDDVARYDTFVRDNLDDYMVRELALYWKRTMKRVDLTSRSLAALIEQGSCFAGFLSEIIFSADRSYMLDGQYEGDERASATLLVTESNFDLFPMSNGISRLRTRFHDDQGSLDAIQAVSGQRLLAEQCEELGLVTFVYDDLDWDDEVRIFLEERSSFSPDSLVGLEANLRFSGPETMETKIFGRLTAWQNWIFQRPSAVGEDGALKRYGTGKKGIYDTKRV